MLIAANLFDGSWLAWLRLISFYEWDLMIVLLELTVALLKIVEYDTRALKLQDDMVYERLCKVRRHLCRILVENRQNEEAKA